MTLVGSPIALNTRATRSASSWVRGEVTRGTQQSACSTVVGKFTGIFLHVLTIFNRYVNVRIEAFRFEEM